MAPVISKSDYLLYRECPHNAWYKIHKPDLYYESGLSDFERAIIETGNDVELVARELFPDGMLIEGRGDAAQQLTRQHMLNGGLTLFQPVFKNQQFIAAVDVLGCDPGEKRYFLYEIKATNSIDERVHYHDLAFQANLIQSLGYDLAAIRLIHLNPEYRRDGDLDVQKLFRVEDVTTMVTELLGKVAHEMKDASRFLSAQAAPAGPCCCIYKGRSNHCATFRHSNPKVPEYGIHDITRIGASKAKLRELVDRNVFELKDIPDHIKLSDVQSNQVEAHVFDHTLIQKDPIARELAGLAFPIYFLDYETYPCAVPRFTGFSPYQQIPFQYSLYVLDGEGSDLRHYEFLCTDTLDPSRTFVESLQNNIGDNGSILVWNKSFECKINSELGERLPDKRVFLDSVNARIYDLMDIFKKQLYVHKGFRGKTSIKAVLPVLVPELSYGDLDIREGGTASQKWNELVSGSISPKQQNAIADNLKKYCGMDTYAMYAIWKHLRELN